MEDESWLTDFTLNSSRWANAHQKSLRQRNETEMGPYADMFNSFAQLYSSLEQYRGKLRKLDYENILRQEEIRSIIADPANKMKISEVEKNLLSCQEENIQIQRDNAGKQKELLRMAMKVRDLANKNLQISELEKRNALLEQEAGVLKGENTTLQLMYNKADEENRRLKAENQHLVDKILNQKKEEVDLINFHNDSVRKIKEHQMFYELEAARREESPNISPESSLSSMSRNRMFSGPSVLPHSVSTKIDAHGGELYALAFSYQGTLCATGGADKCVKVWKTNASPSVDHLVTMNGCNAGVMSIDIDEREQFVMAGSNDAAVRIWGVTGGLLKSTLMGHDNKILTVKFYQHSGRAASGSHDRTLRLWDVRASKNVRTIFARSSCNDLAMITDQGTNIVSGHFDKRLRFWDERQDTSSHEMLLDGRITSVDLSSCGKFLACSCKDNSSVKYIDLKLNQAIATFTGDGLKIGEHTRCSFSPDGNYIACGSTEGTVFVWNTKTLRREEVPKVHTSSVPAVRWHPMGQFLISLDRSKKMFVWSDT